MQGRRRATSLIMIALAVVIIVGLIVVNEGKKHANALWQIVSEQCVPHQQQTAQPAPCQQVDVAHGYATLKDRNGPLQYLLIPLAKIHGIESPHLLSPATPNYFSSAWHERALLAQRRGTPVADSALSLAINSEYGRTQNQLHIHISCLRPDVRQRLDSLAATLNQQWQAETLRNHRYLLRALTTSELAQQSAFIRLATEVPGARSEMGQYGLALAILPDGRLVLMAVKRNWLLLNRASAEELQDHSCALVAPVKKAA